MEDLTTNIDPELAVAARTSPAVIAAVERDNPATAASPSAAVKEAAVAAESTVQ